MYDDDIRVDARVVRVDMGEPENDGDMPHIGIVFDYEGEERKGRITHYRYFSDKALPYTEADLVTLGWDPTRNGWAIDDLVGENQPLAGAECSLVLRMEEYHGKSRLKVKFVNARGGGGVKNKASAQSAVAFAALLRKKVGMSAPAGAKRPAPKQPPQRQPTADVGAVDSDGIPF